jgi:type II secretory pathway pseudopilin PulG
MNCSSENIDASFVSGRSLRITQSGAREERVGAVRGTKEKAFSLAEVIAALMILAFISTSVLVVINRYMASAANSVLRMQAFEVARRNMEELISLDSVSESVEYGNSEMFPDIRWETSVETFYEPVTAKMWIQGICTAEYDDSEGEVQTVELTHWLTDVSKAELLQILAQRQEETADEVFETLEEAADYAGVDEETIQEWIDNGMRLTDDGKFIKNELDLYKATDGNPTPEDRERFVPGGGTLVPGRVKPGTDEPGKPYPKPRRPYSEPDQPDQTRVLGPKEECMRRLPEIKTQEELGEWLAECWSVVTN